MHASCTESGLPKLTIAGCSTVRLLVSGTGTGTTELLGFASSGIRNKETLVVLQKQILKFSLWLLINELLVVCNDSFGNCHTNGHNLVGLTTTTNTNLDVEVLELVSPQQEDWLIHLGTKWLWLNQFNSLSVNSDATVAWGDQSDSSGVLLSSEGLNLIFLTHLNILEVCSFRTK